MQDFSKECVPKKKFLFFNQNICCGYSKESSQCDGSFEHTEHILKLINKEIITILRNFFCVLNWPYTRTVQI